MEIVTDGLAIAMLDVRKNKLESKSILNASPIPKESEQCDYEMK